MKDLKNQPKVETLKTEARRGIEASSVIIDPPKPKKKKQITEPELLALIEATNGSMAHWFHVRTSKTECIRHDALNLLVHIINEFFA